MEKQCTLVRRFYSFVLLMGTALLVLISTGCTTGRGPTAYQGDFLHDYTQLKPDPNVPGLMNYIAPGTDIKKYKHIMLDPITSHINPDTGISDDQINPVTVQKATDYFFKAIKEALEPEYRVVDKPNHGVARLKVAITAVEVQRKDLALYEYVPVALLITGIREASGTRNRLAIIITEAEMRDSLTDRLLGSAVWHNAGETRVQTSADLRTQDIFPALDYWAKLFKKRADALHGK